MNGTTNKLNLASSNQNLQFSFSTAKILLSPRNDKVNLNSLITEQHNQISSEFPITMQEEVLINNNHKGIDYKLPLVSMDELLHNNNDYPSKNARKYNATSGTTAEVPKRSITLEIDNSKKNSEESEISVVDKVLKKHQLQKIIASKKNNNSNILLSNSNQVPLDAFHNHAVIHVPAEIQTIHLNQKPKLKTALSNSKLNIASETIGIEIIQDRNDESFIVDETEEDLIDESMQVVSNSNNFEIYKHKIELPIEKVNELQLSDKKQRIQEELNELKSKRRKTIFSVEKERNRRLQLQFFKHKSKELLSSSLRDISYLINPGIEDVGARNKLEKTTKLNQTKKSVITINHWIPEEEENNTKLQEIDIKQVQQQQSEENNNKNNVNTEKVRLPSLDRNNKKRKKKSIAPTTTTTTNSNTNKEEESEDDSIVDEVIRAASRKNSVIKLPPSKIPKRYHIIEASPIVTREYIEKEAKYNPEKRLWETTIFPSNKPSSRVEVIHLAKAFEAMFSEIKNKMKDDEVGRMTSEIHALELISSEVSRQVYVQCSERGVLIDKVIQKFIELNKKTAKWHQNSLQQISELKEKNQRDSKLVDFYQESIHSKDNEISKQESEIKALRDELNDLKEQLKKARRGLSTLSTDYFSDKNMRDKMSNHFNVSDMKDPLLPIALNENEFKRKFGRNVNIRSEDMDDDEDLIFGTGKVDKTVMTLPIEGFSMSTLNLKERFNVTTYTPGDEMAMKVVVNNILPEEEVQDSSQESTDALTEVETPLEDNTETQPEEKEEDDEEDDGVNIMKFNGPKHNPEEYNKYLNEMSEGKIFERYIQYEPVTFAKSCQTIISGNIVRQGVEDKTKSSKNCNDDSEEDGEDGETTEEPNDSESSDSGNSEPTTDKPKDDNVDKSKPKSVETNIINTPPNDKPINPRSSLNRRNNNKLLNSITPTNSISLVNSQDNVRNSTKEYKLRHMKPEDVYALFKDIISANRKVRRQNLRWLNKIILEIFNELASSDFLSNSTELHNVRKFVYDFFLVKFGLASIAINHLTEFLTNLKQKYKESIRAQIFSQFSVLTEFFETPQHDEYSLATLQLYLKVLHMTKVILNKRALRELEEGSLFVSISFVTNLIEKLELFNENEQKEFIAKVQEHAEDDFIYFDLLLRMFIEMYHHWIILKQKVAPTSENDTTNSSSSKSKPATGNQISISIASFKKMLRTYFKRLYIIKDKSTGAGDFVARSEKISKTYLIEVVSQTSDTIKEVIQNKIKEFTTQKELFDDLIQLKSNIEKHSLEEGMNSYRNYIINLLANVEDETHKVFAIMIQKLVPIF
ncbi:hypothetical protein ABK040_009061 [Willaertia magna]